jgi:hypothetical protein
MQPHFSRKANHSPPVRHRVGPTLQLANDLDEWPPTYKEGSGDPGVVSGLPTIRELLHLMDTSAFIDTNPTDER